MNNSKNILLIIESSNTKKSTSESLGNYLIDQLQEKGMIVDKIHINQALATDEGCKCMMSAIIKADVLVFSFPFSLDGFPVGVAKTFDMIFDYRAQSKISPGLKRTLKQVVDLIESGHLAIALALIERILATLTLYSLIKVVLRLAIRQIAEHQNVSKKAIERLKKYVASLPPKDQQLVAISNSGFPEAEYNLPALDICETFAEESGTEYLGGLGLGENAIIDGRPLESLGRRTKNVRAALDMAAADIAAGRPISKAAIDLMAKPMVPKWIYVRFGSIRRSIRILKNQIFSRKSVAVEPIHLIGGYSKM